MTSVTSYRAFAYMLALVAALVLFPTSVFGYSDSPLSHPRVRILDAEGAPVEGVLVVVMANQTFYSGETSSTGWAVFPSFDGEAFPPGSAYSATKDGWRTVEWSQGDPIPSMVIAREDDTILVILLIALTVTSALILMALSFKGRSGNKK